MQDHNARECKVKLKKFIEKEYSSIKDKFYQVDNQEFGSYLEELAIFRSFLNESAPEGPD